MTRRSDAGAIRRSSSQPWTSSPSWRATAALRWNSASAPAGSRCAGEVFASTVDARHLLDVIGRTVPRKHQDASSQVMDKITGTESNVAAKIVSRAKITPRS